MDAFLGLVAISFRKNFVYRSSVLMGAIGSVFAVVVQIAIWNYVFRGDPAMVRYMTAYVVLARLLASLYQDKISNMIGDKVYNGSFVVDLIKPIHSVVAYVGAGLGDTLAELVTRGLPMLLIFFPTLLDVGIQPLNLLAFFVLCMVGYVLITLVFTLAGHLAFVVTDLWAFGRMLRDTIFFFSGAAIPLAFFPDWLATLTKFLPFHLMYSFPIRVLLGDMPAVEIGSNLLMLALWTVGLWVALQLTYQRAVWRSVAQGG